MASNVVVNILGNTKSFDSSLSKSQGRMSKFGGFMKSAMKVGGLAVAAGAVVAGKALFDMTKGAIEDEAAAKKLATTLKNTAGATDAQVASTEKWISAQGKALGVTDDELRPALGKLATATHDVRKAQELASVAMDVSAGSGKSLDSVSQALLKAYNGSTAGLAKYGIKVKNAKGEAITFEQAQRRLARTFKGQAEANANTLSGKLARLKLVLSEAGEAIGYKLIPVVTQLADWFLNKALPAMQVFGAYLQDKLPPLFDKIREVVGKVFGGGGGGSDIVSTIREAWVTVKSIFTDAVSIIQSLWKAFGANIVSFLRGWIKSMLQILKGGFQIIRGIFKVISSLLKGDWKGVWQGLKLIMKGAVNVLIGLVKNLWNSIKFAFKNAGVIVRAILKATWDGLVNLAKLGASKLVELIRSIPGRLKDLGSKFIDAGKALIGKFFDGLAKLGDIGRSIGTMLLNGVIDAINAGINIVNNAIPNSVGIGKLSIDLPNDPFPNISRLATGGITTGPMLALIGDNPGGREAVIPLDKYDLNGQTIINVTVVAPVGSSPVDIGRGLQEYLDAYAGSGGRKLAS